MDAVTIAGAASQVPSRLDGETWQQAANLGLALALSCAIGLEREFRQKNAGLRTHTLVGVGAALFMLVSKYGFTDVVARGLVALDPSRVAAQIVSGIGFIGAGLIFVRRDSVRGLTTAASIWVTAAIGATAGAGLAVLAALATAMYYLVALAFPLISSWLPGSSTAVSALNVRYPDGRGILRDLIAQTTSRGFTIDDIATEPVGSPGPLAPDGQRANGHRTVQVTLHVHGKKPVAELATALSEMQDVKAVLATDMSAGEQL